MGSKNTTSATRPDMHREDVVAAIRKKGLSVRRLSTECGFKPSTLNNAVNGSYIVGEAIIALFLDLEPQNIWPSRYDNSPGRQLKVLDRLDEYRDTVSSVLDRVYPKKVA